MSKTMGSKLDRLAFSHLVYIKNEATKEFGTGTLLRNEADWYVLTASHVIKKAAASQLYLNIGIPEGSRLERADILIDDPELDFALIKVDGTEANFKLGEKNNPYRFNSQAKLGDMPKFNRMAITGYPNQLVEDRLAEYPERIYFSIWEKLPTDFEHWPDALKESVDPEKFMLIDFHPSRTSAFTDQNGKQAEIFHLHGMSGCPVWILDKDTTDDMQPKYGLYGVFTSFYEFYKLWKFTRIDAILAKSKEVYGIDIMTSGASAV
jgi:hypothetical protein